MFLGSSVQPSGPEEISIIVRLFLKMTSTVCFVLAFILNCNVFAMRRYYGLMNYVMRGLLIWNHFSPISRPDWPRWGNSPITENMPYHIFYRYTGQPRARDSHHHMSIYICERVGARSFSQVSSQTLVLPSILRWYRWHIVSLFDNFIKTLINHRPSIKVKYSIDPHQINFLDTTVFLETINDTHKHLLSKVYFKSTDTYALLDKASYHPKHTFTGIIKSQIYK